MDRGQRISLHNNLSRSRRPLGAAIDTFFPFPYSDIPTMIVPVFIFATVAAMSGQFTPSISTEHVLLSLPLTFIWTWLNICLFCITNQPHNHLTREEPSEPGQPPSFGKATTKRASQLLLLSIPLITGFCWIFLGGGEEMIVCLILTWMYNDLGGPREHFLIRHGINAIAFFLYACGALRVTVGCRIDDLSPRLVVWLSIISSVIMTTLQVSDLKDQEGDRFNNRSTAPIVWGGKASRWSIVFGVAAYTIICLIYWSPALTGYAASLLLGVLVCYRILSFKNERSDEQTYKWWSLWLISLFILPLYAQVS